MVKVNVLQAIKDAQRLHTGFKGISRNIHAQAIIDNKTVGLTGKVQQMKNLGYTQSAIHTAVVQGVNQISSNKFANTGMTNRNFEILRNLSITTKPVVTTSKNGGFSAPSGNESMSLTGNTSQSTLGGFDMASIGQSLEGLVSGLTGGAGGALGAVEGALGMKKKKSHRHGAQYWQNRYYAEYWKRKYMAAKYSGTFRK